MELVLMAVMAALDHLLQFQVVQLLALDNSYRAHIILLAAAVAAHITAAHQAQAVMAAVALDN
jgi:hypothetical protein